MRKTESGTLFRFTEAVRYPVPFHGGKEVGTGLEKKIKREMGLK